MKYITTLSMMFPLCALADWPFPSPMYAFVGVDHDVSRRTMFCHERREASNIGIGQTLYKGDRVEIDAQWTHHSCITEYRDKQVYDGLGVKAKVYLW